MLHTVANIAAVAMVIILVLYCSIMMLFGWRCFYRTNKRIIEENNKKMSSSYRGIIQHFPNKE